MLYLTFCVGGAQEDYDVHVRLLGRVIELVEEPDLRQGTWSFGEGTIHHHAFDPSETSV